MALLSKLQSAVAPGGSGWTLAQDAMLTTFLHEFSQHMQLRATELSHKIVHLEDQVGTLQCELRNTNVDFLLRTNSHFVESRVKSEDHATVDQDDDESEQTSDSTEIEPLPQDDGSAIRLGMRALPLFFDTQEELDDEPDSACYYDSTEDDIFNCRPLPFIVGSIDFMESADAGIGDDDEEEDSDTSTISGQFPPTTQSHLPPIYEDAQIN
jgi:WASH complex subunit FAM21